MDSAGFIGSIVTVVIDRPLGSRHPRRGFHYPLNDGCTAGAPATATTASER